MGEYFIRLDKLVGLDFLAEVPLLGRLVRNAGVRRWREVWNDEASVIEAEVVFDAALSWEWGGFEFAVGDVGAGQTAFRIEIASDRTSLATSLLDEGEDVAGITDPPPREGLQILARADGPPAASLIQIHDISLRIRLPRKWARKGEITAPGVIQPVGDPDHPEPAELEFGRGTFTIELGAAQPFSFLPDSFEALRVDPVFVDRLGVGIEIIKLKLDYSRTKGIPEVLARPGFQEDWVGLYVETFRIYGLHKVFPTLPEKIDPNDPADLVIELSKWVIGFEDGGLSGSLKVGMQPPPSDTRALRGASFELELDRGNIVRAEHQLKLSVDKLGSDGFSLGPDGDLLIVASLRFNPDDRVVIDLALRTPGMEDRGLVSVGPTGALAVQGAFAAWLLIDEIRDGDGDGVILLSALLYILLQLQLGHALDFKQLTLDALQLRYREELVAGRTLKWIDFIADIELRFGLDLPLSQMVPGVGAFLPDIKTDPDHPIGILLKGLGISYAFNSDDFTATQLDGGPKLQFAWPNEYFFDFSDQTLLHGSPILLTKFGFGRWDKGAWIDFGLKLAVNQPEAAYSVMPAVVRLYFLADGTFDHYTFEGLEVSFLVPGLMYARGRLNLGDEVTEAALQGYFISAPGLSLTEYAKPENWNWDVGVQYRQADLADGGESTIVYAWLRAAHGIPTPLPGTSLYGGHFLYASNARPALASDTIERWYADHEPKNQIVIDKWEGDPDAGLGLGLGLVLGATADRGKPWNLQCGLLIADSQLLLTGYLNLFTAAPDPADTRSGALRFLGAFSSDRVLGSVRWTQQLPADGKVLKIDVGAEMLVDNKNDQSHFYAGFHWPPERHLKAILFQRYEVTFYIMEDSADVGNFAGTGVTLPGFVIALGARFAIEGGRKTGHLKLYFYLRASFDGAIAGASPMITVIKASVAGGLVAKAYGIGFEFEVAADFLWIRPQPDLLEGHIKITLDLPWPIPNIHYTLDIGDGEDGETEALSQFIEGLTLLPRAPSAAVALTAPDQPPAPLDPAFSAASASAAATSPPPRVPLDPTFSLTFSYPTRNDAVDGNFQIIALGLGATDTQVWHETSGGLGYAVTLKALRLWRGGVGQTLHPGPVPAKWVAQDVAAFGGQPPRRVLELFSLEDVAVARLIGGSAAWIGGLVQGWTPCAPPGPPPEPVCYLWNDEPLGPIAGTALVEHGGDPALRVTCLAEPDGAESARRLFGWSAQPLEVVEFTVTHAFAGIDRALRLAAVEGFQLPDEFASAATELRFDKSRSILLQVVRPARNRAVTMRFYLGERLVGEDHQGFVGSGLEGRWENALYVCNALADRVVIECAVAGDPKAEDVAVYLLRGCFAYEKAARDYQDAVAGAAQWDQFWTTVGPAEPLILEPDQLLRAADRRRMGADQGRRRASGGRFHQGLRVRHGDARRLADPIARVRPVARRQVGLRRQDHAGARRGRLLRRPAAAGDVPQPPDRSALRRVRQAPGDPPGR